MESFLSELPTDHPLRSRALLEIGAQTKWKLAEKGWTKVTSSWRIAQCSYNDLGKAWTDHWDWRATRVE